MTVRSGVLFVHVVGVLMLFIGLAFEWMSLRLPALRSGLAPMLRRLYGPAFAVLLLSGIYLARLIGAFELPFVRLSLVLMVLMGILGAPRLRARMSESWSRTVLALRSAMGLAAVYLMIGKPPLTESLIVIGGALAAGLVIGAIGHDRDLRSFETKSA